MKGIIFNKEILKEKRAKNYPYRSIPFWISIRIAKNCLFSRRNGYVGLKIFGLSICLRLFNKNIL